MLEYVNRIDKLLSAAMTREDLPTERRKCSHCNENKWAIWRCVDCTMGKPLCRRCMRHTHQDNPFHKIDKWTGSHFRSAELWQAGVYILIEHHMPVHLCSSLLGQMEFLERFEKHKDESEQNYLSGIQGTSATPAGAATPAATAFEPHNDDPD